MFFLSSTKKYKEISIEFVMYCSSWNLNNIHNYAVFKSGCRMYQNILVIYLEILFIIHEEQYITNSLDISLYIFVEDKKNLEMRSKGHMYSLLLYKSRICLYTMYIFADALGLFCVLS